jgi:hypothetical protein
MAKDGHSDHVDAPMLLRLDLQVDQDARRGKSATIK